MAKSATVSQLIIKQLELKHAVYTFRRMFVLRERFWWRKVYVNYSSSGAEYYRPVLTAEVCARCIHAINRVSAAPPGDSSATYSDGRTDDGRTD